VEIFASEGAPPVSTTPCGKFVTGVSGTRGKFCHHGVVDTGGKFATGINDTSGKKWEQYQTADTLK
jgi:hypothetical protein